MSYPTRQEYNMAVKNLDRFLLVPHFKGGVPKRTKRNKLLAYSGGYSRVYPIEVGSKTYALRCWIADIGEAKVRYQKIKAYLEDHPLPYFVDFEYVDEGILVNGKRYPITYMDWIDGAPLNKFLDQNVHDSSTVSQVADEFRAMTERLHQKRISHGDLQEGNILVQKNGSSLQLKLIDYDSLFVPTLQGFSNDILGVPNYQHPARRQAKKVSEKSDYFSELVIYLSLCAYAEKPDLWKKGQEQQLLFSVDDFAQPTASSMFRQLKTLSSKLRNLAEKLEEFCHKTDILNLHPLETVLKDTNSTTVHIVSSLITRPLPAISANLLPSQHQTTTSPPQLLSWADFESKLSKTTTYSAQTPTATETETPKTTQALDNFFNPKPAPTPTVAHETRLNTPSQKTTLHTSTKQPPESHDAQSDVTRWVGVLIVIGTILFIILNS